VGRLIRSQLGQVDAPPDPAALALLFAADRIDHLQTEIEPLLAKGVHVLSDRYVLSSLAYQSIGLDFDWVASINREARAPDLTLLFRVGPEIAAERRGLRGGDEEIYDKMHFQRQVSTLYDELARRLPEQKVESLDANQDFDTVAAELEAAVLGRLESYEPQ
jgi:dTMP kinase